MRGKVCDLAIIRVHHGITPAYAGKRGLSTTTGRGWKDHPRVCGEKLLLERLYATFRGPPPRVRGKVHADCAKELRLGITPAYAGKSQYHMGLFYSSRDHPRVCGEKSRTRKCFVIFTGSPPRVRGKAGIAALPWWGSGITPACAGKSRFTVFQLLKNGDYPRVCGEKTKRTTVTSAGSGLPPRVRGKVQCKDGQDFVAGITPACAGKRPKFERTPPLAQDYPRVCGEKPGIWSGVA